MGRLAQVLLQSLGVRCGLLRLEAGVSEVCFYSIVHVAHHLVDPRMWIQSTVAVAAILYYVCYCYVLWAFARQLGAQAIDETSIRFEVASVVRKGSSKRADFTVIIRTVKCVVVSVVLATMSNLGIFMPLSAAIIEFAFYIYALKTAAT